MIKSLKGRYKLNGQTKLIKEVTRIEKPPQKTLFCFFCGKQIAEGEPYTFLNGEPAHLSCAPKFSVEDFKGHVNEILVAERLIKHGFEVYFPGYSKGHVDILAVKNNRYVRVQVRTAHLQGKAYHAGLGVGRNNARWVGMEKDVDVVVIACPPSVISRALHFFIIPSILLKDNWSLTLFPNPLSKYGEFVDNWNVLSEISLEIEWVPSEKDSKLFSQLPVLYRLLAKQQKKVICGLTKGDQSEIILSNILKICAKFYLPGLEDLFFSELLKRIGQSTLHELIHQFAPDLAGCWWMKHDQEIYQIAGRLSDEYS